MRWIDANKELPKENGSEHMVIVKGNVKDLIGYESDFRNSVGEFVTFGFKNWSHDNPQMFFTIGNRSYLSNNVKWLDEYFPIPSLDDLDETTCHICDGAGKINQGETCYECLGSGVIKVK